MIREVTDILNHLITIQFIWKKDPTQNPEAVTVGSEVDTVQSIGYSRINHLYKTNTVTLNPLCLWDFEEGEEGKVSRARQIWWL